MRESERKLDLRSPTRVGPGRPEPGVFRSR